jgi:hypothetical protein
MTRSRPSPWRRIECLGSHLWRAVGYADYGDGDGLIDIECARCGLQDWASTCARAYTPFRVVRTGEELMNEVRENGT